MHELKKKHSREPESETVLAMQAGGSLGAYECGVFKSLTRHGIKFDIVAGTSIGAVNAGIVAGSKSGRPEKDLEDFWLDVAETITPSATPDYLRAIMASSYSAMYGNPKMFSPIWFKRQDWNGIYFNYFLLYQLPYLYDMSALKDTLAKYVDFKKLGKQNIPRLIVACTDVQTSKYVIFDSHDSSIDATHLVACASYPFYGIGWAEIDGKYLWDGTLLGNTPLVNVIDSSSKHDKKVYIVNVFPHYQKKLPDNLMEVWHRARDIVFTDKTGRNMKLSKLISNYLLLLKEMHGMLDKLQLDQKTKKEFEKLEQDYSKLAILRGAIITDITKIERSESLHFLYEDADFSIATIKRLIKQGEDDTEKTLEEKERQKQEQVNV